MEPPNQTSKVPADIGRDMLLNTYSAQSQNVQRLQEFDRRIMDADATLREPDPKEYKGSASREFKKELARHVRKDGRSASTRYLNVRIAAKLRLAGYAKQDISKAIIQHAPQAAMSQSPERYGQKIQRSGDAWLTRNKQTIDAVKQFQLSRRQSGQLGEKRLNSLGLQTDTGLNHQQEAKISQWKQAQANYRQNRDTVPFQKLPEAQKFQVLKTHQLDQKGAAHAVHPDRDEAAAKYMMQEHRSDIGSEKFHQAIGRNSAAEGVVNKSLKEQQRYGKETAENVLKRELKDQPNQRPERQKYQTEERRGYPIRAESPEQTKQPTAKEQDAILQKMDKERER